MTKDEKLKRAMDALAEIRDEYANATKAHLIAKRAITEITQPRMEAVEVTYTIEEIKRILEIGENNKFHANAATIIRDLLSKIEKYQRKHAEFGDVDRCPLARECSEEWGCEESWAKYWEEE